MLQTGESRHLRQIAFAVAVLPMAVLFNFPSVVLSALNGIINQISEVECLKSKGRAAAAAKSVEITADTYAKHIEKSFRNFAQSHSKQLFMQYYQNPAPFQTGCLLSLIEGIDSVFFY